VKVATVHLLHHHVDLQPARRTQAQENIVIRRRVFVGIIRALQASGCPVWELLQELMRGNVSLTVENNKNTLSHLTNFSYFQSRRSTVLMIRHSALIVARNMLRHMRSPLWHVLDGLL